MDYRKVKDAAKRVVTKGPELEAAILGVARVVSTIVGDTLGPGGRPVLIERSEADLPPFLTKDGVTVFKSLGFEDSVAHCIMECMRDAAQRTANVAGDGTTTATVLAEAIVRRMVEFCKANPTQSPQKTVRRLEALFRDVVEPTVRKLARPCDLVKHRDRLEAVARVSANGDAELARAVLGCYDIVGDAGNVTIVEHSGNSGYEVDKINGYPIGLGYDECCGKYYPKFINDPQRNRCVLEKPVFILYHGKITEIQTVANIMMAIGTAWGRGQYDHHNVVLVATGFSDSVLGQLALNFFEKTTINVFPLLAPMSPAAGAQGQLHFLQDLHAVTGAKIFDPMNETLDKAAEEMNAEPERGFPELGPGVERFEASRTKANIIGQARGALYDTDGGVIGMWEDALIEHADNLRVQLEDPESRLDKALLQERLGKVTGGIARLKVVGSSNGEVKEKRDRAEDAVCAAAGAMKHGCLPGGGWTLAQIMLPLYQLGVTDDVVRCILVPALKEPIWRLALNAGLSEDEAGKVVEQLTVREPNDSVQVYDAQEHRWGDAFEMGVLDSVPAVLEAIRSSISIATVLGTLGGCVVHPRDSQLERREAEASAQWLRDVDEGEHISEADKRS